MKLEEITKRLFQPVEAVNASTPAAKAVIATAKSSLSPNEAIAYQPPSVAKPMAAAVGKVFGQAAQLQSQSSDFRVAIQQLDRINQSVGRVFLPLREVYTQLSDLSGTFESLQIFRSQLEPFLEDFEPMRLLHEQVTQLIEAVQTELGQIVTSLDPLRSLSERVKALAYSLKQVNDLQHGFADLYSIFGDCRSVSSSVQAEEDEATLH